MPQARCCYCFLALSLQRFWRAARAVYICAVSESELFPSGVSTRCWRRCGHPIHPRGAWCRPPSLLHWRAAPYLMACRRRRTKAAECSDRRRPALAPVSGYRTPQAKRLHSVLRKSLLGVWPFWKMKLWMRTFSTKFHFLALYIDELCNANAR